MKPPVVLALGVITVLGLLGCQEQRPTSPLVDVSFDWQAWTSGEQPTDSASVDLAGLLLSTRIENQPPPTVITITETIDEKRYLGVLLARNHDKRQLVFRVLQHGEKGRVVLLIESKVPFSLRPENLAEQPLTWRGIAAPMYDNPSLAPGNYRIEIEAK